MERLVRVDQTAINKHNPDSFALQTIFKELGVGYEYLVSNEWVSGPPVQRPEGRRIVFEDIERFRIARDVYFAWKTISSTKTYSPVFPEEIIARLIDNRKLPIVELLPRDYDRYPLCLFMPWGVRPQGKFGYPEKTVLDRIRSLQVALWQRNINAQVLIMPADLYATEINSQVESEKASEYFDDVKNWAHLIGFFAKPWSAIRQENIDIYQKRSAELTPEILTQMFIPAKIEEAFAASSRRSGYQRRSDIQQAAFAYLRERICEAEIIESVYRPIKISAVSKNKDNDVDRDLPRLYIIPGNLQFPWLK